MDNIKTSESRWRELFQPAHAAAIVMLSLGVALFALTSFLVGTALPSAVKELGGEPYLSWAQSLYLAFAIVSGFATSVASRWSGVRWSLAVAIVIFVCGTLLCVFATSIFVLLVGRALQGLAAGYIEAQCYAFIFVLFPKHLVSKVFGAEAVVWVTAAFAGPALAGVVTEHFGWRAAFALSLPLALGFIALALKIVPSVAAQEKSNGFPGLRLGLVAGCMLMITFASVQAPLQAAFLLLMAAVLLPLAARLDRHSKNRMLPHSAFTCDIPFGLGFWVVLLMPIAEAASTVFLIYGLQNVFGLRPTTAAALAAIIAVSWSFTQIAVSTYARQELRREMVWIGAALLAVGLALSLLGFANNSLWLVALSLVPVGAAFGMNWGSIGELLINAAAPDEKDRVAALLPTTQAAGFGIGAALAGLIANTAGFATAKLPGDIQEVLVVVFAVATAISLPAVLAAYRTVKAVRLKPSK